MSVFHDMGPLNKILINNVLFASHYLIKINLTKIKPLLTFILYLHELYIGFIGATDKLTQISKGFPFFVACSVQLNLC